MTPVSETFHCHRKRDRRYPQGLDSVTDNCGGCLVHTLFYKHKRHNYDYAVYSKPVSAYRLDYNCYLCNKRYRRFCTDSFPSGFLILVAVCVTCIQNYSGDTGIYLYMPVYGQFYGIGNALTKEINIPQAVCCILSTSALSAAMLRISESLLSRERFTVSIDSAAKEIKRAATGGKPSIIERINKTYGKVSVLIDQLFYPLIVLSVFSFSRWFRLLYPICARQNILSSFQISEMSRQLLEIMSKAFEVIGIFMSNPFSCHLCQWDTRLLF